MVVQLANSWCGNGALVFFHRRGAARRSRNQKALPPRAQRVWRGSQREGRNLAFGWSVACRGSALECRDLSPLWVGAERRGHLRRKLFPPRGHQVTGPARLRRKPRRRQVARTPHAGARQNLRGLRRLSLLAPQRRKIRNSKSETNSENWNSEIAKGGRQSVFRFSLHSILFRISIFGFRAFPLCVPASLRLCVLNFRSAFTRRLRT